MTGCEEKPGPSPLEGMSEEQKEYEAMQLVNLMDKMTRTGMIQPCRSRTSATAVVGICSTFSGLVKMGDQRLWTMCCSCKRPCREATRPGRIFSVRVVDRVVVFVLAMQGGHQAR